MKLEQKIPQSKFFLRCINKDTGDYIDLLMPRGHDQDVRQLLFKVAPYWSYNYFQDTKKIDYHYYVMYPMGDSPNEGLVPLVVYVNDDEAEEYNKTHEHPLLKHNGKYCWMLKLPFDTNTNEFIITDQVKDILLKFNVNSPIELIKSIDNLL